MGAGTFGGFFMEQDDTGRRINAVRRLMRSTSPHNRKARLAKIAEIAGGGGDLDACFRAPALPDLAERLAAGQASRSPITGQEPPEDKASKDEKKRKKRNTRDRQETSGRDRGAA